MEYRQVRTTEKCPGCGGAIYQLIGTLRAMGGEVVRDDIEGDKSCENGCRLICAMGGEIVRATPR